MSDADRAEPHIGMAQHHPLGPAGRAGGVEQGGEIVGIGARRRQAVVAGRAAPRLPPPSSARAAGGQVALAPASPAAPCRVISSLAPLSARIWRDLRPLQQRIDRHMDQPGAGAGERQQAGHPVLGQPARDPVARREPPRLQRRGERADRRLEPGIIEQRPRASSSAGASGSPQQASDGRADGGSDRGLAPCIPAAPQQVMLGLGARRGIAR